MSNILTTTVNTEVKTAVVLAVPAHGGSYGMDIQKQASDLLGQSIELVDVYETLNDLVDEGKVTCRPSLPNDPRSRKVFELKLAD